MAKKGKGSFNFSPSHLIRLALFIIVFFYLISLFSRKNQTVIDPTLFEGENKQELLNDIASYLFTLIPDSTKQKVVDIPNTAAVKGVSQQLKGVLGQILELPKKLINDLKVEIATSIYQSIISQ